MKNFLFATLLIILLFTGCSSSHDITNIIPQSGTIIIPANGTFRMWKDVKHGSFTVTLTNSSPDKSVELYKVTSGGNEKWINPSLRANSSQQVTIPVDGHLFVKNFNDNIFNITYNITK